MNNETFLLEVERGIKWVEDKFEADKWMKDARLHVQPNGKLENDLIVRCFVAELDAQTKLKLASAVREAICTRTGRVCCSLIKRRWTIHLSVFCAFFQLSDWVLNTVDLSCLKHALLYKQNNFAFLNGHIKKLFTFLC